MALLKGLHKEGFNPGKTDLGLPAQLCWTHNGTISNDTRFSFFPSKSPNTCVKELQNSSQAA